MFFRGWQRIKLKKNAEGKSKADAECGKAGAQHISFDKVCIMFCWSFNWVFGVSSAATN